MFVKEASQKLIDDTADFAYGNYDGIWYGRLPGLEEEQIKEVQRAILQLEVNKRKLQRGERLPQYHLTAPYSIKPSLAPRIIRVRLPGRIVHPEQVLPIFDPVSLSMIGAQIGFPNKDTPKELTPDQRRIVEKNMEIVNAVAGTNLHLPRS